MKDRRNNMTELERDEASKIILQKLEQHPKLIKASRLLAFYPAKGEINTIPFLESYLHNGGHLYLPKVTEKHPMQCVRVNDLTSALAPGRFGICEPLSSEFYEGSFDVAIVPGLAFSRNGERLGYGGGFYDYFFKDYDNKHSLSVLYKIGIGFGFQLIEKLPIDPHDVLMNEIVVA